jgi:hypothetical protein
MTKVVVIYRKLDEIFSRKDNASKDTDSSIYFFLKITGISAHKISRITAKTGRHRSQSNAQ